MSKISLCMIVKNEEEVLARCLNSVRDIADEIIIVDTGSTDGTKKAASAFTDKIYDFPWCDDFAKARNFSFSKATMDYLMWLDADDVIDEENRQRLLKLKQSIPEEIDIIMLNYHVAFDPQNNPTFSYYRERIFKKSAAPLWIGAIHEVIPLRGNLLFQDIAVCHKKIRPNEPERNLRIFEKMLARGEVLDPRQQYYYGRELYYNGYYEKAIDVLTVFLNQEAGWIENKIGACKDLSECYEALGQTDKVPECLFRSFTFDVPRAEICCEIGRFFLNQEKYTLAAHWYEAALACPVNEKNGGFYLADCHGYIPFMQLCVCHDRLGSLEKAIDYNERAGALKPEDSAYLYNKKYFASFD